MVIIHSRDNLKRVSIENRHRTTVLDLKQIIETQLGIPHSQPNPIHKPEPPVGKSLKDLHWFIDMANPDAPL